MKGVRLIMIKLEGQDRILTIARLEVRTANLQLARFSRDSSRAPTQRVCQ